VTSTARIGLAFAVSPAASTLTVVAALSVIGHALPSVGYVATVAALAYGVAVVLGIPAFLLSRGWRLHSITFHATSALVVSSPLLVISALLTKGPVLPLVAGLGAVAGGVIFHAVTERSTNGV
jgi:uncharacterized membrane protein